MSHLFELISKRLFGRQQQSDTRNLLEGRKEREKMANELKPEPATNLGKSLKRVSADTFDFELNFVFQILFAFVSVTFMNCLLRLSCETTKYCASCWHVSLALKDIDRSCDQNKKKEYNLNWKRMCADMLLTVRKLWHTILNLALNPYKNQWLHDQSVAVFLVWLTCLCIWSVVSLCISGFPVSCDKTRTHLLLQYERMYTRGYKLITWRCIA